MPTIDITSDYRQTTPLTSPDANAFFLPNHYPGQGPTVRLQAPVTVGTTVDGHARLTGFSDVGSDSTGNAFIIVDAGGSLTVRAQTAYGLYSDTVWTPNFANFTTVTIEGRDLAVGVTTLETVTVRNNGTMTVSATVGQAIGISLSEGGGGFVVNTGSLTVSGRSGAVAVDDAHWIENSGVIRAIMTPGSGPGGPPPDGFGLQPGKSVAVSMSAYNPHFLNTGTIEGDYALVNLPFSTFGGQDLFTNRGTMIGTVYLPTESQLVNQGLIQGAVFLGNRADSYEGRDGRLTGVLRAGDGDDSVAGGAFAETLVGDQGADTISGGDGDDLIEGGRDADLLDGGLGIDTVTYASATQRLILNLTTGRADSSGQDTISGFERVVAGDFGDSLTGSAGADTLDGGAGDDSVTAGVGADSVAGGAGSDYLRGDDGADSIAGGAAFDDINGNMGDDTASGGDGDDWVVGGKDNDVLAGDAGGDLVYGNLGNDTCDGGDGNDIVRGGQDNDVVRGGAGDDFISGDKGDDTMTGGAGADLFHTFGDAGIDRVTDFNLAQGDRVMLDPDTRCTFAQVGADTVISMIGGGQMILVGVALASLSGDWIFGS